MAKPLKHPVGNTDDLDLPSTQGSPIILKNVMRTPRGMTVCKAYA
jgi:hypothetical protein